MRRRLMAAKKAIIFDNVITKTGGEVLKANASLNLVKPDDCITLPVIGKTYVISGYVDIEVLEADLTQEAFFIMQWTGYWWKIKWKPCTDKIILPSETTYRLNITKGFTNVCELNGATLPLINIRPDYCNIKATSHFIIKEA